MSFVFFIGFFSLWWAGAVCCAVGAYDDFNSIKRMLRRGK